MRTVPTMLEADDLSLINTTVSTEGVSGAYRRYDRLGRAWILATSCPLLDSHFFISLSLNNSQYS